MSKATSTTIVFKILPDGGFVAGDTATGVTSYAYPSSIYATAARKKPAKVAADMIQGESSLSRTYSEYAKEYDRKNWETLNKEVTA
jgi:uncharacterized protein (DUF608 family)